jgi:RNA polymerase sigma-70 factor (ECF subfamily)
MNFSTSTSGPTNAPSYGALVSLPDEVVMAYLADGNHDSLAVIFDRYQRLVMRVAFQILRDPAEAEDAMQSVFIAVLESAKKFCAEKGTLRVWILQHAYHLSLNRRRYLSIRGSYDNPGSDAEYGLGVDAPRAMLAADSKRLVQQALSQLTARQRETLELAFYEGMTMLEIAERTGQSHANIRHHYYRGLEKLRVILGYADTSRNANPTNGEDPAYAQS